MIFSRFDNVNLFRSMLADCSVPRRREWGHKAGVGRRRPPWSLARSQGVVTRMAIKTLIMINFSSFKGTDLSRSMLANCFLPQCRDRGAMGRRAAMVAATSAEDFISLIVWYNTRIFLCRKKENTAHNARQRAKMNGQINIDNNN
jgi:hypothetical protein